MLCTGRGVWKGAGSILVISAHSDGEGVMKHKCTFRVIILLPGGAWGFAWVETARGGGYAGRATAAPSAFSPFPR